MATIWLLGHKARSGKDTVGEYLKRYHGFECYAFATPIKEHLANLFNLSREQLYGSLKDVPDERFPKPGGGAFFTPREMMQKYGNDVRAIWPDAWANQTVKSIDNRIWNGEGRFVIMDFRMRNEATVVKRWAKPAGHQVYVVKVLRPETGTVISGGGDQSEHDLNNYTEWDNTILNNGTVDQLYQSVEKLVTDYFSAAAQKSETSPVL